MATTRLIHPNKRSGPAWSFASKKPKPVPETSPGPAAYSPEKYSKKITVKIGTQQRPTSGRLGPAPGDYSQEYRANKAPSYSLRPKTARPAGDVVPGPDIYSPTNKDQEQKPIYSFRGKFKPVVWSYESAPGPGQYENRPQTASSVRIGTARRKMVHEAVPGPGAYHAKDSDKPQHPNYKFGTMQKSSSQPISKVGPGSYSYNQLFDLANYHQGKTMNPRRIDLTPYAGKGTPGPGTYEAQTQGTKRKNERYSVGKEKRLGTQSSEIITGPGSYENTLTRGQTVRIGTESREKIDWEKAGKPGPGTYAPKRQSQPPAYTMRVKKPLKYPLAYTNEFPKVSERAPGPGAYDQKLCDFNTPVRAPTYKFNRQKKLQKNYGAVPGPGKYESHVKQKKKEPVWKFGTAEKTTPNKHDAGTTYNIPASTPIAPGYLLPGQLVSQYASVDA